MKSQLPAIAYRSFCGAWWCGVFVVGLLLGLWNGVAQAAVPAVSEPTVRICYLIPTNRVPQTNGVTILQNTFLFYREWYREQMELNGFGPTTFNMETESDGWTPKVWVVDTTNTDSYLASNMWSRCWSAASQAGVPIWQSNNIWFVIGEAQIMETNGSILGHSASGLGYADKGLAVLGGDSMAIMDPKYLTNNTAYDGSIIAEIGSYPLVYGTSFGTAEGSTFASLASTYFGTCCHEFGHAFNLTHDFRNDWNFLGNNMANGCRGMGGYLCPVLYTNWYSRQTYEYAVQLSLSRFFNPSRPITDMTAPVITKVPTGVVQIVDGKVKLDFTVTDPSGLGVALLSDAGGDFGSGVIMEQKLSGTSNDFTLLNPYYSVTNGVYTNGFRVQDVFGNEAASNFVYTITGVTNRCPWVNLKILPPMPAVGQTVTFDASDSHDPDDALSDVTFELDFNSDGVYDTAPIPCTSRYYTNFSARGLYMVKVRVTDPHGASSVCSPVGMRVGMVTHFVRTNSPLPMAPYNSWITAATNLQDAINAAKDGDTVVVGPGVYRSGGAVTPGGTLTNRVCITNAITIRADAGPDQTTIEGASDGGGFGPAAIRCAFVGSNAILSGFTLSNGWTMSSGDTVHNQCGGGALVIGGSVTNCRLLANSANVYGGGAGIYYGGSVLGSTLAGNYSTRGGAVDLQYSGGTSSLVQWCDIHDNVARDYGGGAYCRGVGLVANSLIYSNTAGRYGGGVHLAYTSRVENCAVYANAVTDTVTYGQGGGVMCEFNGPEIRSCTVADNEAGREGGGIYFKDGTSTVVNSIFYFNTAPTEANWGVSGATGSRVIYSCTAPTNGLPSGLACAETDPLFEDEAGRDYRLTRYSPALNVGLNSAWASNAVDLAGNARITGVVIDMGAYENPNLYTPEVTTDPVTNITDVTAGSGGTVTHEGSYPVTARGLCWSTSKNPTVAGVCTTNGSGIGAFSAVLTNLSPGVVYHVRAYAANSVGTGYGEDRTFNTIALLTNISAGLTGAYYSAVAWGDVDSDGDLDILLSGYSSGSSLTRLYRNDGGAGFTNVTCGLPNCYYSALALGDYDRDGDLDVLISGTSTYLTRLYNNDGTGMFVNTGASFPSLRDGSAAWGDYDNDGDLDLLLTGHSSASTDGYRFTRIYRNDNGSFTAIESELPAVYESSGSWGDYDRDGDLDVLISGDSTGGKITCVYANIGDGVFSNINAGLVGIDEGKAAWGDYDNDGYMDILLSGNATTRIYHNNGDGTFTDIDAGLQSLSSAAVAWGDCDGDGDLDALVCGYSGTYRTYLYRNDGSGAFSLVSDANLAGVYTGDIAWGDYDKDGRLDVLLAGNGSGGALAYVYRNQSGASNTPPFAPSGLTTATNGLSVTMSWNVGSDGQTPSAGLTYNLRVSTVPGGENVMPCTANTNSGWRRLPAMGNAGHNTSWSLNNLQGRTSYYWSVQAVDAAFAGGAWAAEGVFVAPCAPSVTTLPASNITATTADGGGDVTDQGDSPVTTRGCVWSTNANPTLTSHDGITTNGSGTGSFDSRLTGLVPATLTYHVRAYAVNGEGAGYGEDCTFSTLTTPPGNAVDFDGTNDYVLISDADDLDLTNNYTLECWFKADSFGTTRGLISKYQTTGANGSVVRLNTNNLVFDQLTTSNMDLQIDHWYHVAAVNSNGTRSLYLDGVEQSLYGTALAVKANTDPLRLGSDFSGRYFDGRIDEVRLWSAARTEAEIRDAMHRELNGDETNLVAYYSFNSLSGTTLYDRTGNGHDGTLVNGPVWTNSTIPCAEVITNRTNLRAVWSSQTNSLASGRFSLNADIAASDEHVVFGHDEGANDWIQSDLPPGMKRRLGRVWQMEAVGTSAVSVSIDVSGIELPDVLQLRLMSCTNGVFADGATLAGGTLDGDVFTVADQTLVSGQYCTLGEYYGVWYVDASRPDDGGDGMSWATAKRTIQAAVDMASSLDTIWVTNGVYDVGGTVPHGQDFTNRVAITEDVAVRSVNGPSNTFIVGASDNGTNGPLAVRCVWMSAGLLTGFTVTNGHTQTTGDWTYYQRGGGVFLNQGGTVSNCVISGNSANITGGGVDFHYGGLVVDSIIERNTTTLNYGGAGASLHRGALLDRCIVRNNVAAGTGGDGGGLYFYSGGTARNCLIAGNTANDAGGGMYSGSTATNTIIENCTVASNVATRGGGEFANWATNVNCVVYGNAATAGSNNWQVGSGTVVFDHCCTAPLPDGTGNMASDPQFISAGDWHLQSSSPCIDRGTNLAGIVQDMDGMPRPLDGDADGTNRTDIGCYEFVNANADSDGDTMKDGWELGYGLDPTNATDALIDSDGDTIDNRDEFVADTDPTDGSDYFFIAHASRTNSIGVTFGSSTARVYSLEQNSSLVTGHWSLVSGPVTGSASGATTLIDTNNAAALNAYRVGVTLP